MIDQLLRILVKAGATPLSAARAAVILDRGGTVAEAHAVIEVLEPARYDVEALVAQAARELERVQV